MRIFTRILGLGVVLAVVLLFACCAFGQSSGPNPPPPPVCSSANAGAIYTNTGTSPATVYTCSYYNLAWQWVVNPSYGGVVYYPTLPSTCSGALPVFLSGWPDTKEYLCVSGFPALIGTGYPGANTLAVASSTNASWRSPLYTDITALWGSCTGYLKGDGTCSTSAGVSQIIPGSNVTISPSGGTGAVTINSGSGLEMQPFTPPATGQYVVLPGTVTFSGVSNETVNSAPGFLTMHIPNLYSAGYAYGNYSVAIPSLPSYVLPANITAIYVAGSHSQSGAETYTTSCPGGANAQQANQDITSTGLTYTCSGFFGSNATKGGDLNAQIEFYIYYTGTAPPVSSGYTTVNWPLVYDPIASTLSLQLPYDVGVDTGTVNAASVVVSAFSSQYESFGEEVKFSPAYANTSTMPTFSLNGVSALTITKCGQLPLAAGDYTTTDVADVIYDGMYWELQNPVTGCSAGSSYTLPIATTSILGGVKPDGTTCTVNGTTGVLSCTGGGSSGVSQIIAGSGIQVSPSGGTGAVTVSTTGGSGGNLITGANVVFTGDSLLVDDSQNTLGAQITATAVSCASGGLCTVTAPQSYVAGQWLDFNPSGFSPSCISAHRNTSYGTLGYYGTGTELYQVLPTGLSSSQFQIQTTCGATTGTGGTIEDATYFMSALTAAQPAFSGANAWYLRNGTDKTSAYGGDTGLVCEQATNFTAMFGDLLPSVTGKPLYLLEEGGTNDLGTGVSESALEGCFQSFWAQAHAAGAKVIQNLIPQFDSNSVTTLNNWLMLQGKSSGNAAAGQYWDFAGVDTLVFGTLTNPPAADEVALISQAWDASVDSPGASGFTLTACNPETDCANLKESNYFSLTQFSYGGFASTDAGQADSSYIQVNNGSPVLGFAIQNNGGQPFIVGKKQTGNLINGVIPGTDSLCWNTTTGEGTPQFNDGVIGLSIDASNNYLDVGSCTTNDFSKPLRAAGLGGPATAPSGSCSLPGEWVFSQDGAETYCSTSTHTWTTFGGGGGGIKLTTTGTSGAATYSGGVLNIPQYSGGGTSGTQTLLAFNSTPITAFGGTYFQSTTTMSLSDYAYFTITAVLYRTTTSDTPIILLAANSTSCFYSFNLQNDGNLVLYNQSGAITASGSNTFPSYVGNTWIRFSGYLPSIAGPVNNFKGDVIEHTVNATNNTGCALGSSPYVFISTGESSVSNIVSVVYDSAPEVAW